MENKLNFDGNFTATIFDKLLKEIVPDNYMWWICSRHYYLRKRWIRRITKRRNKRFKRLLRQAPRS